MILISANDNNSWRYYRFGALKIITAWAYEEGLPVPEPASL